MSDTIQGDKAIVLFDGVCNFCNDTVNFIIRRDRKDSFRFAALQSEIGQKLLRQYDLNAPGIDSVVLIENGRAFTHSTAALKIARRLGGAWQIFSVFQFVPRPARDFFYRLFARNRYRLFGKREVCMMPTPEIKARFLS
ncbi:MAG TPA: thiol-disulfide oxidoreductase DCC family protein [Pyrinomonadaceae bacterium]|nr:thiol-disulfide oxidoreductase DCC family protein [Pyrinomonadaceae bacterium]